MVPAWRRYEVHWEDEALPERGGPVPDHLRRLLLHAPRGLRRGRRLRRGLLPARRGRRPLLARAPGAAAQVLFHPKAEVVHLGHTSQTSPLKVEFHKGVGLARYFRKRAAGPWHAMGLAAVAAGRRAAVARPLVRRLKGQAA